MRTLLVILLLAGCKGEAKPKLKPDDAGPVVTVDAARADTPEQARSLFLSVPTAKAAADLLERFAAVPSGRDPADHVAREVSKTLGRLNAKMGTAQYDGAARPIRNLLAFFPGTGNESRPLHSRPGATDQAIIIGNSFDRRDRHTGTAALVEITRGLTALSRAGWRPRRTIVIGFWDGDQEVSGANRWVEEQRDMLRDKAVAYFELDVLGDTSLASTIEGSPSLREHARQCLDGLEDQPPVFEDLAFGSGRTGFLHHAGIATLRWRAQPGPGMYPPDRTAAHFAKVVGACAIALASAEDMPFKFSETASWLDDAIARTPLDRKQLDPALEALRTAATRAESLAVRGGGDPAACHEALRVAERGFLVEDGLPGRPWYRHLASGPVTLPEVAAAKNARQRARATERLAAAINRVAAALAPCP